MVLYAIFMSLGLGTAISGSIYYIYDLIHQKIQAKMYCIVKIKSDDQIFWDINKYMKDFGYVARETSLRARVMPVWKRKDKSKTEMEYLAGYGNHVVDFNGRRLWVIHNVGETIVSGWERKPQQQEWIDIYAWGNDSAIIKEFIDATLMHRLKEDHEKIKIY